MDLLSAALGFFWLGLPLAATAAGVGSMLTGDLRLARFAVGAFVVNVLSVGIVFFAFVPGALAQKDPASEATILAGALAEGLNGSCLMLLGLPGAALAVWRLRSDAVGAG